MVTTLIQAADGFSALAVGPDLCLRDRADCFVLRWLPATQELVPIAYAVDGCIADGKTLLVNDPDDFNTLLQLDAYGQELSTRVGSMKSAWQAHEGMLLCWNRLGSFWIEDSEGQVLGTVEGEFQWVGFHAGVPCGVAVSTRGGSVSEFDLEGRTRWSVDLECLDAGQSRMALPRLVSPTTAVVRAGPYGRDLGHVLVVNRSNGRTMWSLAISDLYDVQIWDHQILVCARDRVALHDLHTGRQIAHRVLEGFGECAAVRNSEGILIFGGHAGRCVLATNTLLSIEERISLPDDYYFFPEGPETWPRRAHRHLPDPSWPIPGGSGLAQGPDWFAISCAQVKDQPGVRRRGMLVGSGFMQGGVRIDAPPDLPFERTKREHGSAYVATVPDGLGPYHGARAVRMSLRETLHRLAQPLRGVALDPAHDGALEIRCPSDDEELQGLLKAVAQDEELYAEGSNLHSGTGAMFRIEVTSR